MHYLLLATIALFGIATSAELAEARGRGVGAANSQFSAGPKQTRILRPAEFVVLRPTRPLSKR